MIKKIEVRGTKYHEVIDYFEKYCEHYNDNHFTSTGLTVTVDDEGLISIGKLFFPRIFITFEGDDKITAETLRIFRLRFLSMGG